AAPAAAALLDLRWRAGDEHRLSPGTASATAFKAYQSAEELRKKPNDDGLEDAIEKYKEAIEADPQYALAYGQLAIAYLRLNALKPASGALELAEANAGKAVQLNSKLAEGHLALASVAKWKGERDQAFAEMRTAISLDPTNPRILLWQAQMYAHFNQFEEARAAYLRLKAERPNYWLAYNELGFLYFSRRDYRGAIEMYRAASLAAPKSSMVFNSIGVVHLTIGDLAEATRNFENSIKLKPNSAAYTNLAETHLAQGKYEDAIACAKRAIALSPGADEYWMDLADSYDAAPGMKHQAIEAYRTARNIAERVLRDDSSDANAWIRLALYKAKTGERVAAMELVRKFDQFPGSDVDSKLVKARILELLGRRREALAVVQESLQTGATRFEVESIADLSHLRNDPAYVRIAGRSTTAKWN
ncbi:MAG: tetratricopeptide repeat protein, partial [Acidobacteriaceae bacterium]|nr:tetratricopeptide repeat protein [Acidobacteriaceae bacterium]